MNSNPRQPLEVAPQDRVTLEQLKHRAESVQNLAVSEAKRVTNEVAEQDITRKALMVVGTVVVVASIAYYLGRRASQRLTDPGSAY